MDPIYPEAYSNQLPSNGLPAESNASPESLNQWKWIRELDIGKSATVPDDHKLGVYHWIVHGLKSHMTEDYTDSAAQASWLSRNRYVALVYISALPVPS